MRFWEQIKTLISTNDTPSPPPAIQNLQNAVEAGQRAKRAEHFAEAIQAFDYASGLAQDIGDYTGRVVIAMHKAEALMGLREWESAEQVIQDAYESARERHKDAQVAYLLNGLGVLCQEQGDWTQARSYYEDALKLAREAHAPGAEGRSLGHLADAYLHDGNASYAIHLLRESLPRLNIAGDTELSSLFVGRLGQAMIATGQTAEGDQLLIRALRLAKQLGYRKYERSWGIALGERTAATGQYEQANQMFKDALAVFPEGAATPEYVRALYAAGQNCLSAGLTAEALDYAQRAFSIGETLTDSGLLTSIRGLLGMAFHANQQVDEAIPYLEQTAGELASDSPAAPEQPVTILRTLAAAYARRKDLQAAEATYQRAIQQATEHGLKLALAQSRRDLGLFYQDSGRYQDAINQWSAALTIYESANQPAQLARLYCDLAYARRRLGQGARSLKDYENALITLNMLNDDWETRGLVLSNAANAYVDQGDIDSADAFFNESLAIARRLNDHPAEAVRRGNYGWFLLITGRPQQALSILDYALKMSQQLHLELPAAIQTDNLGVAYDMLGQYQRALTYHQQALEMVAELNNPHWTYVFKGNQAQALLALGEVEAAAALFAEVVERGRADQDFELLIQGLTGTAQVALAQKLFDHAGTALDEALALAHRIDVRRLLAEALSVQSEYHAALNRTVQSAAAWEEASKLFKILHHPQAKIQPAWLNDSPTVAS